MITKQKLIEELNCIVKFGDTDYEVYDNLITVLNVLNNYLILDNDATEEAIEILEKFYESKDK